MVIRTDTDMDITGQYMAHPIPDPIIGATLANYAQTVAYLQYRSI